MTETSEIKKISVSDLHFDVDNPRLAGYGISRQSNDEDILRILWDAMDVRELVQSIAASGFFQHEPLIVARKDDRNIVIEDNRRLAAVKVLLNDPVAKKFRWEIPTIPVDIRRQLESLPVIISDRQKSWRYLGFKHVNGPAKWSSYAKANGCLDLLFCDASGVDGAYDVGVGDDISLPRNDNQRIVGHPDAAIGNIRLGLHGHQSISIISV